MSNGLTPFAGYRGRRYHYGHNWSWAGPEAAMARHKAASRARWKRTAPPTATTMGQMSRWLSPSITEHFRQVNRHGKDFGPRLQLTGERWIYLDHDVLVAKDQRGETHALKANTRIRVVQRQPEDQHSAACRALKAQWRQTRNDRGA